MTTSPNEQFLNGGTIKAINDIINLDLPSTASSLGVSIFGTFVATLILEQSLDYGDNWQTIATVTSSSFTRYGVAAVTTFRVRCSAYTSGAAQVHLQASIAGNSSSTGGGGATSDVNLVGINGTPPSITNPLAVELSDGSNPVGTPGNPLSVTGDVTVTNTVTVEDSADGTVGDPAPPIAIEIGLVNSIGDLTAAQSDMAGALVVGFLGQLQTVFQEILLEVRTTRKLLCMVYEESGEGNPSPSLVDDPSTPALEDYQ